jgi:phosphoglycerol transferase
MTAAPTTEATAPTGATDEDGARSRHPWVPRLTWRAEAVIATVLSSGLFVVGFGGGPARLSLPLSGGDLLPPYVAAHMWSQGSPLGNNSLGFPFGMELRYYPTGDLLQNFFAGLVAWATDNPFLGLNLVFAASFPLTALAALWVFRVSGMRGPWAVLASLALTFIPYHWLRLVHIYLGTMYSVVLGVGLALLVANGTVQERLRSPSRLRFALFLLLLAVLIGASGIYYACFTVLLCAAACLYRAARGSGWRDLLLCVAPAVAVALVLAVVLAPATLYVSTHPPFEPVADRLPIESVVYSGVLVLLLLPAPISRIPGFGPVNDAVRDLFAAASSSPTAGVLWDANFGSVATIVALAIVAVGGFQLVRRSARYEGSATAEPQPVSLGLLALLSATTLLFFVPWGLNFLFAYVVTAQLRGWDRLVPVIFTLLFIGAGVVLQRLKLRVRPAVTATGLVLGMAVLLLDSVLPYRSFYAAAEANGGATGKAGYAYAADLNTAVPGQCGVLQLPYMDYPEVPPKVELDVYDPLWPALTNPTKSWSSAAMKGTPASAWQRALGDVVDAEDVPALEAGGFCAVHLDLRGYAPENRAKVTGALEGLLGAPVAVGLGGNWLSYALPSPAEGNVDVAELTEAPGRLGTFYSPPMITPAAGVPADPVAGALRTTWALGHGRTEFSISSIPDGADFTKLAGELDVEDCSGQQAILTLRAGEEESTLMTVLAVGEAQPFSISLNDPVREAELSLRISGPDCDATDGDGATTVSVVDLHAEG